MTKPWDELRREARRLESDIDAKLAHITSGAPAAPGGGRGDIEAGDSSGGGFDAQCAEVEGKLAQLRDVNDAMGGVLSGGNSPRGHVLGRHRDILRELTTEFRRVRGTRSSARDQLLGGRGVGSVHGGGMDMHHGGLSAAEEAAALLGDRASLQGSTANVDAIIGQARNVANALNEQRGTFSAISGKLQGLTSAFPAIHNVVNSIRRKRSRDTIVLACVVCTCTLFVVGYWLAK